MTTIGSITELLQAWNNGDPAALNRLMPLVETELRKLARRHMRREETAHTLEPTALVNELYLKLVNQKKAHWLNRTHFFAIAAELMRRILIDHARRKLRDKRGGGARAVPLHESAALTEEKSVELLALNEALDRLAETDSLKSRIVVLRHFGGLSVEETAEVLGIAPVTVMRHWNLAKSWLKCEVRGPRPPGR
ncbi:MAG TPA: sigma-70 family RNA polymerase sigma factor [Pyrinomonadaceae bacterium]|nr:sigma-70 family RNA polymerase sigma factor [Pyrinomonadaceae bacterium]